MTPGPLPRARLAAWILAVVVALPSAVVAQAKWVDPYHRGTDAIKNQKWTEAVDALTQAIAVDPRAQANKITDGVYREDYFPYYYRGLAYFNLNEFDKAHADLVLASQTHMADPLMQHMRSVMLQIEQRPAAAAPPDPHAVATEAVKQGNALFAAGHIAEAQAKFTDAQKLWAQVPGASQGLTAAANRTQYESLKAGAAQDRRTGKPADALAKYLQAKAADPLEYAADHLEQQVPLAQGELTQLQQQANASSRVTATANGANLLAAGVDLARQHKYAEAEAKYQAAVETDHANAEAAAALKKSQSYARLSLAARTNLDTGNLEGARGALQDAQALDGERFLSDGLDRSLADIVRRLTPGPAKPPAPTGPTAAAPPAPSSAGASRPAPHLYDALVAYLKGDMTTTIQLLQPVAAADGGLDPAGRAAVHAYLGAAYATSALEARSADDRDRWHGKAVGEFKVAWAAQPGFHLSGRIVSPAIQAMIDEARKQ